MTALVHVMRRAFGRAQGQRVFVVGLAKMLVRTCQKVSDPLKVLGILRRDISSLFLQHTRAQKRYMFNPRE